jgi:hypothetical protein
LLFLSFLPFFLSGFLCIIIIIIIIKFITSALAGKYSPILGCINQED